MILDGLIKQPSKLPVPTIWYNPVPQFLVKEHAQIKLQL